MRVSGSSLLCFSLSMSHYVNYFLIFYIFCINCGCAVSLLAISSGIFHFILSLRLNVCVNIGVETYVYRYIQSKVHEKSQEGEAYFIVVIPQGNFST